MSSSSQNWEILTLVHWVEPPERPRPEEAECEVVHRTWVWRGETNAWELGRGLGDRMQVVNSGT